MRMNLFPEWDSLRKGITVDSTPFERLFSPGKFAVPLAAVPSGPVPCCLDGGRLVCGVGRGKSRVPEDRSSFLCRLHRDCLVLCSLTSCAWLGRWMVFKDYKDFPFAGRRRTRVTPEAIKSAATKKRQSSGSDPASADTLVAMIGWRKIKKPTIDDST